MTESPYQLIKRSIAQSIQSGQYSTGQVLPSENDLCRSFGVSRMTVNRAMRELAAARMVRRVPGVGTFVATPAPQSELLEIRNIATEIQARGHHHRAEVFCLEKVVPPGPAALAFGLTPSEPVFRSAILHFEQDQPVQFEDRLVNPQAAPDYLDQDFTETTPNEYLSRVAPIERGEHLVQAIAADAEIAAHFQLITGDPCLLVSRRTWSAGRLVTITKLYHPGDRFSLGGRFSPAHSEPPNAAA
jgi:GntR family histidine utilization transcriptional repressor